MLQHMGLMDWRTLPLAGSPERLGLAHSNGSGPACCPLQTAGWSLFRQAGAHPGFLGVCAARPGQLLTIQPATSYGHAFRVSVYCSLTWFCLYVRTAPALL